MRKSIQQTQILLRWAVIDGVVGISIIQHKLHFLSSVRPTGICVAITSSFRRIRLLKGFKAVGNSLIPDG